MDEQYRVVVGDGGSIQRQINEIVKLGYRLHSISSSSNGKSGSAGVTVTVVAVLEKNPTGQIAPKG